LQCGCLCNSCSYEDPVTRTKVTSNDQAVCKANVGSLDFSCSSKDSTTCGSEYSTAEQLPYCAIKQPSTFAPLYDLSGGLNETEWASLAPPGSQEEEDGGGGGPGGGPAGGNIPPESKITKPIITTTKFMYTGKTPFGEATMNRVLRQPDLTPLVSDPLVQAKVMVRSDCLYKRCFVSVQGHKFMLCLCSYHCINKSSLCGCVTQ
jgi:hypothetical protein